jgi:hypothetical protein
MVQNENGLKRAAFPDLSKHTGKMGSYQNNGDASLKSLCMPELYYMHVRKLKFLRM